MAEPFVNWDESQYQRFDDPEDELGGYDDIDEDLLSKKIDDLSLEWTTFQESCEVNHAQMRSQLRAKQQKSQAVIKRMQNSKIPVKQSLTSARHRISSMAESDSDQEQTGPRSKRSPVTLKNRQIDSVFESATKSISINLAQRRQDESRSAISNRSDSHTRAENQQRELMLK